MSSYCYFRRFVCSQHYYSFSPLPLTISLCHCLSLCVCGCLFSCLSSSPSLSLSPSLLSLSLSLTLFHSLSTSHYLSLPSSQVLTHVQRMFSSQQMLLVLFNIGTCQAGNVFTLLKIPVIKFLLSTLIQVQSFLLILIFIFFKHLFCIS